MIIIYIGSVTIDSQIPMLILKCLHYITVGHIDLLCTYSFSAQWLLMRKVGFSDSSV